MRWRKLIEEYFVNNDEGTNKEISIWLYKKKYDLFFQDELLKHEAYFKGRTFKFYEPNKIVEIFVLKDSLQTINVWCKRFVKEGLLIKEENNIGSSKWRYRALRKR